MKTKETIIPALNQLANAILEKEKHNQLCPKTIDTLKKIAEDNLEKCCSCGSTEDLTPSDDGRKICRECKFKQL